MSDEYPYEGTVFGDYQLIRGLGHGGFADVYLGTDIRLGILCPPIELTMFISQLNQIKVRF